MWDLQEDSFPWQLSGFSQMMYRVFYYHMADPPPQNLNVYNVWLHPWHEESLVAFAAC